MGRFRGEKENSLGWLEGSLFTGENGGLGMKRLEDFSKALLFKWRWRILEGSSAIWFRLLKARYGDIRLEVIHGRRKKSNSRNCSIWWLDLCSLGKNLLDNFFNSNCRYSLGDGYSISFWYFSWMDGGPLKDRFPAVFDISVLKEVYVACIGGWLGGMWQWGNLGVMETVTAIEDEELFHLQQALYSTVLVAVVRVSIL